MTSYSESAYSDDDVLLAVQGVGYDSVKDCIASLSTKGYTLTNIARHLSLNPQRFWAYYQAWCQKHAEPLRLNEESK